jgi:hypothetical protein
MDKSRVLLSKILNLISDLGIISFVKCTACPMKYLIVTLNMFKLKLELMINNLLSTPISLW